MKGRLPFSAICLTLVAVACIAVVAYRVVPDAWRQPPDNAGTIAAETPVPFADLNLAELDSVSRSRALAPAPGHQPTTAAEIAPPQPGMAGAIEAASSPLADEANSAGRQTPRRRLTQTALKPIDADLGHSGSPSRRAGPDLPVMPAPAVVPANTKSAPPMDGPEKPFPIIGRAAPVSLTSLRPTTAPAPFPVYLPVDAGQPCPCGCQPSWTTRTVQVPCWTTEYVQSTQTCYRQELRQRQWQETYTVYDEVPYTESYIVQVPEPRSRTYTVNLMQEFQVPVQENYTVMVAKPQQREVTEDREEPYQVPYETPYTVMVPERQEYQETSYKTVIDKEPVQKKYVVNVPRERERLVTRYEKVPVQKTVRKPVVRMVNEERIRPKVEYRTEIRQKQVIEKYVEYVERERSREVTRYRMVPRTRSNRELAIEYEERSETLVPREYAQKAVPIDQVVPYKVAVPYVETKQETYYVNEPYEVEVTKQFATRIQVPRTVTKTYQVQLPVTDHLRQNYIVNIPEEILVTCYRTVTRQVPVTCYRTVTRDLGCWERRVVSCPTCSVFQDPQGCQQLVAGCSTTIQNQWCPRIVTQCVPYTDFISVQEQVPYQVPQLRQRQEVRTRMIPRTRYTTEQRTAELTVFDYQDQVRSQTFKLTKYRWVPRTRPITVKQVREEDREKTVPFVEYQTAEMEARPQEYRYRMPVQSSREVEETYMERVPYTETETVKVMEPVERTRTVEQPYTVRIPVLIDETYTVAVPQTDYREVQETEYIEVPRIERVKYTEMVPEFRTRVEMVEVQRQVPVFTTRYRVEMVPQIRTRTSYRTETRTVADRVMKTFMVMVPEVRTRTVYKTKYRDVPVTRTELEWIEVPQTRYRTRMRRVPRQLTRQRVQTYTVHVPYQVATVHPRQVCRMEPRTVAVPLEPYCSQCGSRFDPLADVSRSYLE